MANEFVDKYGRIHDRPVVMGEPSSDNGWFYSAVYVRLGGKLNIDPKIGEYCTKEKKRHPMSVPGREEIPISRDEILGLAYLGYLKPEHLDGWNFSPYEKEGFNLVQFTKEALYFKPMGSV